MCEVSSHVLYRKTTAVVQYIQLYTVTHLADAFIQSDLQSIQIIHIFVSTLTNEHVTLMLDNQKVSFVFILNNILFRKILNIHTQTTSLWALL